MSTIYALAILAGKAGGDYMQVGSSAQNLTKEQTKISIWVALLGHIIEEAYNQFWNQLTNRYLHPKHSGF